jgi:small subunit ribosomal protein S6e
MKFVISDTKSGKAYSATTNDDLFIGKKINDTVKLDEIGLTGFEAEITGGSDKDGFPMNKSVHGTARRYIFTTKGIGFKKARKGERKRLSARGNTISSLISQVNLKVTKVGSVNIDKVFGKEEQPKDEETMSAKELALKRSKELAGSTDIGDAPTKKSRH